MQNVSGLRQCRVVWLSSMRRCKYKGTGQRRDGECPLQLGRPVLDPGAGLEGTSRSAGSSGTCVRVCWLAWERGDREAVPSKAAHSRWLWDVCSQPEAAYKTSFEFPRM